MRIRSILSILSLISVATMVPQPASAQTSVPDYPSGRPIRILVTFTAGGGADTFARYVSDKLSKELKTPVIVDPRPGAGGVIAMGDAAKAKPDGYTLILASATTLLVNPAILPKLPYDPQKAFAPVIALGRGENILVANPSSPINNIDDLVAAAKSAPENLQYASFGIGTTGHMCYELIAAAKNVKLQHIPYAGSSAVVMALLSGQAKLGVVDTISALTYSATGKLKVIGVCTEKSDFFPGVQSFKDAGIDFHLNARWVLLAPAKTPEEILDKLYDALDHVARMPDSLDQWKKFGITYVPVARDALTRQLPEDQEAVAKFVKSAGIKPD